MKLSKPEYIVLIIAALFILVTVSFFLVSNHPNQKVVVETGVSIASVTTPIVASAAPAGDAVLPSASEAESPSGDAAPSPSASATVTEKININTADSELLQTLPGIGVKRAEEIIAYRTANGPFQTIYDLTLVSGIGSGILEQVQDYICVE